MGACHLKAHSGGKLQAVQSGLDSPLGLEINLTRGNEVPLSTNVSNVVFRSNSGLRIEARVFHLKEGSFHLGGDVCSSPSVVSIRRGTTDQSLRIEFCGWISLAKLGGVGTKEQQDEIDGLFNIGGRDVSVTLNSDTSLDEHCFEVGKGSSDSIASDGQHKLLLCAPGASDLSPPIRKSSRTASDSNSTILERAIMRKSHLREGSRRKLQAAISRSSKGKKGKLAANCIRKIKEKSALCGINLSSDDTRNLCDFIKASV